MLLEREERGLETHDYNQLLLSGMRVRASPRAVAVEPSGRTVSEALLCGWGPAVHDMGASD